MGSKIIHPDMSMQLFQVGRAALLNVNRITTSELLVWEWECNELKSMEVIPTIQCGLSWGQTRVAGEILPHNYLALINIWTPVIMTCIPLCVKLQDLEINLSNGETVSVNSTIIYVRSLLNFLSKRNSDRENSS